jgi:phosphoserine phosphatase RsbU/P
MMYVNAGHVPPLLVNPGGIQELGVGGMILGPDPEAEYKLGFAHLDRGGSLVLCTDGVVERGTTHGAEFGMEGLLHWLRETAALPVEAAVDDLLARLRAFGGGRTFEDDVTVVLVRRLAD